MKTRIVEIEQLANSNLDDAVRLSGEELAHLDNVWRNAHNRRESQDVIIESVRNLADMAVCHCDMLMRAELFTDAYATAVTSIMAISIEGQDSALPQQMMALTSLATMALDAISAYLNPGDADTATHFTTIVKYCASMLYYWYAQTVENAGVWHSRVTPLLRMLIRANAVDSPNVTVSQPNESHPSISVSASNTALILPDMIGRSIALNLMTE